MTVSLSSGTSGTTFVMHTRRWRKLQGILIESRALVGGPASRNAADHVGARMARLRLDPALDRDALRQPMRRGFRNFSSAICRSHRRRDTGLPPALHHDVPADGIFDPGHRATRQGLSGDQLFAGVETLVVTGAPITPGMRIPSAGYSPRSNASPRSRDRAKTSSRWIASMRKGSIWCPTPATPRCSIARPAARSPTRSAARSCIRASSRRARSICVTTAAMSDHR